MPELVINKMHIDRDEYRRRMDELEPRLGALQRTLRERNIPLMIAVEGWEGAGKGTLINKLILALDPRGYKVYPTTERTPEEKMYPRLWRFWNRIPANGRIVIFDQSWYRDILGLYKKKHIAEKRDQLIDDVSSFERILTDDGTVIIKVFLHISSSEQKKRFKKTESDPELAWKIGKDDWKQNKHYKKYRRNAEYIIEQTNQAYAPWVIISSEDRRAATVVLYEHVISEIEDALADKKTSTAIVSHANILQSAPCAENMHHAPSEEEYRDQLDLLQERMRVLEHAIYRRRIPVIVACEGWDAAGKGGNIRRLVASMDPRGYEVIPIAAPNDLEKNHHYLWRFWREVPKAGHIAIFDRTWYGRVLVERVEGFCSEAEWSRAYREINEFEQQWTSSGGIMIKFWLEVSPEEQLQRFKDRQQNPDKQWKITEEDWRNREKRSEYQEAVTDMLRLTSTVHSPWWIIDSNNKYSARIQVLKTVTEQIERVFD